MEPGIYVLSETVLNPKPDRRQTAWLGADEWTAGDTYLVEAADGRADLGVKARVFTIRRLFSTSASSTYLRVRKQPDGNVEVIREAGRVGALARFVAALVPSKDPRDAFRWTFYEDGCSPSSASERVLWVLVQVGKISVDDVRAVLRVVPT